MKAPTMHLRRTSALASAALLLAVPVLSSCGFDLATERIYTPAAGANNRDGVVDVLGAVIVAGQPDAGSFIATLSNNSADEATTLDSLTAQEGTELEAASLTPVDIAPQGYVNLADDGGIKVTGAFEAGQYVAITVGFGNGEDIDLKVPVVTACGDYEGLDAPAATDPSASPSAAVEPEGAYSCETPSAEPEE